MRTLILAAAATLALTACNKKADDVPAATDTPMADATPMAADTGTAPDEISCPGKLRSGIDVSGRNVRITPSWTSWALS